MFRGIVYVYEIVNICFVDQRNEGMSEFVNIWFVIQCRNIPNEGMFDVVKELIVNVCKIWM